MQLRTLTYTALVLACVTPAAAKGQGTRPAVAARPGEPAWVAEQFFVADSFPEKAEFLTGEMAARYADVPTMRAYIPDSVSISYRELERRGGRVVYAVTVHDPAHPADWYAYIYERRPGRWALGELRSLALPPLFFAALNELEASRDLADSLVVERDVMRLTASSDSALRA